MTAAPRTVVRLAPILAALGVDLSRQRLARPRTGARGVKAIGRGYPAPPGTGPARETCKSCHHLTRKRMAGTYLKCELMRHAWTGGHGTDVKAGSPACRLWERA